MQLFLVATASLVCMAYALPQDYTYTPTDSESYVYDPATADTYAYEPVKAFSYDQSQNVPEKDQKYVYNYDASKNKYAFTYDPSKGNKNAFAYEPKDNEFTFNYNPDTASNQQEFNLDSLTELTDSLNLITGSKLFASLGGSNCAVLKEIPEALAEVNTVVKARSGELNNAFSGLQAVGRSGIPQPGATVRQLGSAVGAIEPLIPLISKLFTFDSSCGGESRKKRQAASSSICADPAEVSKDVFLGLADLLDLTVEISGMNLGRSQEIDTNAITEQATLIRDGADLLQEINLTPLLSAVTLNTECPTNIGELRSSIDDLADLVDIMSPEEEQVQTRVVVAPAATRFLPGARYPAFTGFVQRPRVVVPRIYY